MLHRTDLAAELLELADCSPERAAELRVMASLFDEASAGFFSSPQTVELAKFLHRHTETRNLLAACKGEMIERQKTGHPANHTESAE